MTIATSTKLWIENGDSDASIIDTFSGMDRVKEEISNRYPMDSMCHPGYLLLQSVCLHSCFHLLNKFWPNISPFTVGGSRRPQLLTFDTSIPPRLWCNMSCISLLGFSEKCFVGKRKEVSDGYYFASVRTIN